MASARAGTVMTPGVLSFAHICPTHPREPGHEDMATGIRTRSVQCRACSHSAGFALAVHDDEHDSKDRPLGEQRGGHCNFSGSDRGVCTVGGVGHPPLLGIWLVVSPWILGFAHTRAMHFSIGIGVLIAFLSALELFLLYDAASDPSHQARDAAAKPH